MTEPPRDPYARYRPEGSPQSPRFIPNEPVTAYQPQSSYQPSYGQPQQEWGPRASGPPPAVQAQPPKPRKKRRVFMWVFFAIQVIFIIWIVAGIASKGSGPSAAAQAAQQCANGGWQPLFKSQADCVQHYAVALNDAANTGKGIGVALIVIMWVVIDFFLGLGYGIYRLATR
jgi:hypothetical protein